MGGANLRRYLSPVRVSGDFAEGVGYRPPGARGQIRRTLRLKAALRMSAPLCRYYITATHPHPPRMPASSTVTPTVFPSEPLPEFLSCQASQLRNPYAPS